MMRMTVSHFRSNCSSPQLTNDVFTSTIGFPSLSTRTCTSSASHITLRVALLPFVGSVVGIGTIVTIYLLTRRSGHLPFGISTPLISLLGCKSPEHEAYQLGFSLTAILLCYASIFGDIDLSQTTDEQSRCFPNFVSGEICSTHWHPWTRIGYAGKRLC